MIDHYALQNQSIDQITWEEVEQHLEYELRAKKGRIQDQITKLEQEIQEHEQQIQTDRERLQEQIGYQQELIEKLGGDLEPDSEMRDRILELNKKLVDLNDSAFNRLSDLRREKRQLERDLDKIETAID